MFSKYQYIYQVYKEKSFTKAAEKLFISQPSLSAAVKNIEKKLGAEIFERTGNGVNLTEFGREYILSAEKIIKIEEEFQNRVNDIYNLETGHITVGGSNYLSSYVLPQIINRFTSQYPNIDVTLVESNSTNLREMVKNEQIDIIVDGYGEIMGDLQGYPLANEKILLCVPKENKINKLLSEFSITPNSIFNKTANLEAVPPVSIDVFKNEKFILLKKGNDMYNHAVDIFSQNGINPEVVFSVDQLNISFALSESGMGLCFVTDTFFKYGNFTKNILLYNVGEEYTNRTLYVIHKKNRYCTRAMNEFIKITRECIK